MDTSALLSQYLGDSPVVYMIAGLSLLILINLALSIIVAARSKEIDFHLLPDFINPLLQYTIFLIATQALVIATTGIPAVNGGFVALQGLACVAVILKYYASIRQKLNQLGMKIDKHIDEAIDQSVNTAAGISADTTEHGGEE
jgi:hypothetical protein